MRMGDPDDMQNYFNNVLARERPNHVHAWRVFTEAIFHQQIPPQGAIIILRYRVDADNDILWDRD